ncbi:MAG: GTPase HflX, partial [Acidiferrobacterales bacterium]|nr:GTPase HflX [Acidiferrobacterales bacterium]
MFLFKSLDNEPERGSQSDRAILVKQVTPSEPEDDDPFREIGELASSAGAALCGRQLSARSKPVAATYIGKGKAEDLARLVEEKDATLVIVDHDISPVQERNLEKIIGCRVLDRAGLILDIFAQRATSSEGKLQVELAQLKHLTTRLVRGWTHLERQKGGIGLRGPGETQLETDRRLIGMRIKTLSRRLQKVESQRALRRRARHRTPIPTVSLVGYTNAGKSSLFNALTDAGVYAADKLFATLDPTMRRVELPGFGAIVLSDTVGFVRKLPHSLVAAFHSTLEEVVNASCLLLVNDCSDPAHLELRIEVERVLAEIGAKDVPMIVVNNKIDLSGDQPRAVQGQTGLVDRVWLSAETGEGVDLLQNAIADFLGRTHRDLVLSLKPAAGELRARLYSRCEVQGEEIDEQGNQILQLRMSPEDIGWLESKAEYLELWKDLTVDRADDNVSQDLVEA